MYIGRCKENGVCFCHMLLEFTPVIICPVRACFPVASIWDDVFPLIFFCDIVRHTCCQVDCVRQDFLNDPAEIHEHPKEVHA
jgi:hypothetical protein